MSQINGNDLKGMILTSKKSSYILINKLGSGSYATVWMCYVTNTKKLMAIKMFKDGENKTGNKEIEIYKTFNKSDIRNTIKMYDSFTHKNSVYIVVDLMLGSLYDIMKKGSCNNENYTNGYPLKFINKIALQLLYSINDLHKNGIIHGDIKPENILIYGRTTDQHNLLKKLLIKTSNKRISEVIKREMKNVNIIDSSDSESNTDLDNDLSDSQSQNDSDCSLMSNDPEPIELIDSEKSLSDKEDTDTDTIDNKFIIHLRYIEEPIVKLSDFGSCVFIDSKSKPNSIQTKYYRAPEIILGLEYGTASELWALGCTLYELVTGEILFNPDEKPDIDDKRCILSKIYNAVGPLPKCLIDKSPLKNVFFTDEYTLKVNVYDDNKNIFMVLCEKGVHFSIVSIICNLLKVNPSDRVSIL